MAAPTTPPPPPPRRSPRPALVLRRLAPCSSARWPTRHRRVRPDQAQVAVEVPRPLFASLEDSARLEVPGARRPSPPSTAAFEVFARYGYDLERQAEATADEQAVLDAFGEAPPPVAGSLLRPRAVVADRARRTSPSRPSLHRAAPALEVGVAPLGEGGQALGEVGEVPTSSWA